MGAQNQNADSNLFNSLYPHGYHPYRLKWFDIAIAILVFLIVSVLYVKTLTPSMGAGDNGELTTTLYNMGASHPPGYPLYGIMGKIFTFLPFGDVAYRVNLAVALCGAAAAMFLFLFAVKLLGLNRDDGRPKLSIHIPAIGAAFLFAFSMAQWQQSTGGEVYPLNEMLVSVMLFIMALWYEEMVYFRNEGRLHFAERMTLLLAFVMGLSLTNHMLPMWYISGYILILLPGTIFVIVSDRGKQFMEEFKSRIWIFVAFIGAVLVSLLLFWFNAYSIRLLFEDQVPWILIAIFLIPVLLTVYTVYVKVAKLEANWVDKFLEVFNYGIWLFIFAMTVYLYLVVRAKAVAPLPDPKPLSWGDTQTLSILFNHMMRKQYGAGGGGDLNNFLGQVGAVFNFTTNWFTWVNMVVAGVGLVYLFLKDKLWAIFSVVSMALLSVALIKFVNFELDPRTLSFQEVMYIQNGLFIALYCGFAFQLLFDLSNRLFKPKAAKNGERPEIN